MKKILMFDDNDSVRSEWKRVLEGFDILEAASSSEARALFLQHEKEIHGILVGCLLKTDSDRSTVPFVTEVRRQGFRGLIAALVVPSGAYLDLSREQMCDACELRTAEPAKYLARHLRE